MLSGSVVTKSRQEDVSKGGGGKTSGGGGKTSGAGVGCFGLVDLTFWRCWARWPMIIASESGQYLVALEYVRPSKAKVSQLPALMASSQVCLTGNPRQAW